ncbi:haloacid dehalogenase type II [Nocardioides sp. GXQ0305]|uniref:haloacid dehalogenase type II n=1 Tax=Nocardioides sp. GXQ0305 TaxID=3423912 RepID=UPI003D7E8136
MTLAAHDVLAFDVYGTLVDTGGVVDRLTAVVGDRAGAFSDAWRQQQLGYSWRRALMRDYVDFGTCTAQALDHTAAVFGTTLGEEDRSNLLATYRRLPAFPDVAPALARLAGEGRRTVAFSNGPVAAADELLVAAGVRDHLSDVVSTDEIRSFKPDPAVYHHLLERVATVADRVVLVSSNSFDVLGAKRAGLQAAWVRRTEAAVLDPWGVAPDATVTDLTQLVGA